MFHEFLLMNSSFQSNFIVILDLQFSSEDEFDEVPFSVDDAFESNELKPLIPVEVRPDELPADDDSQQVAEAMIQLGNAGSYLDEPLIQQNGKYDNRPIYPISYKFKFLSIIKRMCSFYLYIFFNICSKKKLYYLYLFII
jgi:hypothetical protein